MAKSYPSVSSRDEYRYPERTRWLQLRRSNQSLALLAQSLSICRYSMHMKNKLLCRPEVDEDDPRDSVVLPKFSFESDERPLVSTERLFREWQEQGESYNTGCGCVERGLKKEEDIIVRASLSQTTLADELSRSPGKGLTIPEIL